MNDNFGFNPITEKLDLVGVSKNKLKQILAAVNAPLVFAGTVIVTASGSLEANKIAVHSVNKELTFTGPIVPDETLLTEVKCEPGWVWVVLTGGLSYELGQIDPGDTIIIVSPTDGEGLHAEVLDNIVPIGYQFIGVADPTTNDNDIDVNVKCAWFAATAGTYTGLGNVVVDANEIAVITRVSSGGVASYAKVSLGKYVKTSDIVDDLETDDQTKVLSAKQGKVLKDNIDSVGRYQNIAHYIYVCTDHDNKIIWAIKQDGAFFVEKLVNKELEAKVSKEEGRSLIDSGVASMMSMSRGMDEYLEVVVSENNRIIESTNLFGEKHISKFDRPTENMIKEITNANEVIDIPVLDANFTSPVPCRVYELGSDTEDESVKGDDTARYEFDLPLSAQSFNIRFEFKITEDILNDSNTTINLAKLGNIGVVTAKSSILSQITNTVSYNGNDVTNYVNSLRGGVSLNDSNVVRTTSVIGKQNIGLFAFYVKYKGSASVATLENDGEKFILTEDGIVSEFAFEDSPTVYALYSALETTGKFDMDFNELEGRTSDELAKFGECRLNGNSYYKNADDEYVPDDGNSPFFIPYAVDPYWHVVEIVKIDGILYSACDGIVKKIDGQFGNTLVLGGPCKMLLRRLTVHTRDSFDAEIFTLPGSQGTTGPVIVSSANPSIVIFEGHAIVDEPSDELGYNANNMSTTPDRMQKVFAYMMSRGYMPVSIDDVATFYQFAGKLPKRCFTIIFDDFQFDNCLDLSKRSTFTRLGVKPALAIITGNNDSLTHNGVTITKQEAVAICKTVGFGLVSHTRNHRDCEKTKNSQYISEYTQDIYNADDLGVNGEIIVYPYGHCTPYLCDTLLWLGVKIGVDVDGGENYLWQNQINRSRYELLRIDMGMRTTLSSIINRIL